MDYAIENRPDAGELVPLFETTFAASEGAEEGRLIGALVGDLLSTTPRDEIRVYTARDGRTLAGAIVLTRLHYPEDPRIVYLLSPVAVAPACQGRGVGGRLLSHGLDDMRERGVDIVISYGDPSYYGRVGFVRITQTEAAPPLPLSHPEGWIGQSLVGGRFPSLQGPSRCAPALSDPAYW